MALVHSPHLVCSDGAVVPLRVDRWVGCAENVDTEILAGVKGPVLDVGCGPGRHVAALAANGIVAMGIDISHEAVALAERRGAPVLERSVFDAVPATGRWATALLLDGSIGIGGNPLRLLERIRELLANDGTVIVEVEGLGIGCRRVDARIRVDEALSNWFPWARVGVDGIEYLAHASGFVLSHLGVKESRWFAFLNAPVPQ
jgi:SAM-dependent methyltransferase